MNMIPGRLTRNMKKKIEKSRKQNDTQHEKARGKSTRRMTAGHNQKWTDAQIYLLLDCIQTHTARKIAREYLRGNNV